MPEGNSLEHEPARESRPTPAQARAFVDRVCELVPPVDLDLFDPDVIMPAGIYEIPDGRLVRVSAFGDVGMENPISAHITVIERTNEPGNLVLDNYDARRQANGTYIITHELAIQSSADEPPDPSGINLGPNFLVGSLQPDQAGDEPEPAVATPLEDALHDYAGEMQSCSAAELEVVMTALESARLKNPFDL